MKIFSNKDAVGDVVKLKATNPKHFSFNKEIKSEGVEESFGTLLNNALKSVNNLQLKSDEMTTKMITHPDEVNIHDVMIAAEKAKLSLDFLKAIRDRAIRAYQEIINMR